MHVVMTQGVVYVRVCATIVNLYRPNVRPRVHACMRMRLMQQLPASWKLLLYQLKGGQLVDWTC